MRGVSLTRDIWGGRFPKNDYTLNPMDPYIGHVLGCWPLTTSTDWQSVNPNSNGRIAVDLGQYGAHLTPNTGTWNDPQPFYVPDIDVSVGDVDSGQELVLVDSTQNSLFLRTAGDVTVFGNAVMTGVSYMPIASFYGIGETEAANYLWSLLGLSTTQLRYLHEYGAGSNELHDRSLNGTVATNGGVRLGVSRNAASQTLTFVSQIQDPETEPKTETVSYTNAPTGGASGKLVVHGGADLAPDGGCADVMVLDCAMSADEMLAYYFDDETRFDRFAPTWWIPYTMGLGAQTAAPGGTATPYHYMMRRRAA